MQLHLPLFQTGAFLLQGHMDSKHTVVTQNNTGDNILDSTAGQMYVKVCETPTSVVLSSEAPSLQSFSSLIFSAVNPTVSKARYTFSIVSLALSYKQWTVKQIRESDVERQEMGKERLIKFALSQQGMNK